MVRGAIVDLHKDLSSEERSEALLNVAIKSPEHLKRWLEQSGREFLVFRSADLVDALSWPDGVDLLMQLVAAYRDHRGTVPTGRSETQPNPVTGEPVHVPLYKSDVLEPDEMERLIAALTTELGSR